MSGENRTNIEQEEKLDELKEDSIPYVLDEKKTEGQKALETKLKDMSPAQKEQLEKLKTVYEEKISKMRFKANLKTMAQSKAAAKRKKAEKVARKQRKINRKK